MDRRDHQDIRIGTLARMAGAADYIRQILPHGFESFQLTLWRAIEDVDVPETAKQVKDALGDRAVISSVGIYGNPLQDEETERDWKRMIEMCRLFDCDVMCGFAGVVEGAPVDESMARYKEVYSEMAKIAEDNGVKIAFENCDMRGTWEDPKWNIAHSPHAWEMMFDAVPSKAIGLEWEPCHQMVSLIDPIANLRQWVDRVYHVHGKDATIGWDVIRKDGIRGGKEYVWHRTPGFGDTNWSDVITILRQGGFQGAIDIEGWHDPIYKDELEMTGQVRGLNYLKECRGGPYIENPS